MKFLKRLAVGVIFAPLTLLIFYLGGIYLQIFLGVLVLFMLHELRINYRKKEVFLPVTMLLFGILLYSVVAAGYDFLLLVVIFAALLVISAKHIFLGDVDGAIQKIATALFSMLYVALFLAMLYRLRMLPAGRNIVLSLLLLTWLTDTSAYLTGILLGRRKGIIKISPKKSLEGYLGGILFSVAGSFLVVSAFELSGNYVWMLAVSTGLIGQYGDLFESLLKRDLKIKDSSRLLSEHGGILDRFDSLLFAAPALYIMIKLTESF